MTGRGMGFCVTPAPRMGPLPPALGFGAFGRRTMGGWPFAFAGAYAPYGVIGFRPYGAAWAGRRAWLYGRPWFGRRGRGRRC